MTLAQLALGAFALLILATLATFLDWVSVRWAVDALGERAAHFFLPAWDVLERVLLR